MLTKNCENPLAKESNIRRSYRENKIRENKYVHTRQIKTRRWRWIGRVLRMKPDSLPRAAPTWAPEGKRNRGRPRKTWRRTAERERCGMGFRTWVEAETTWIPGLRSRLK